MGGQRLDDLPQPFELDLLGCRLIDFEHLDLLDSRNAIWTRVKPGAQEDNLINIFAEARLEKIVDVALPANYKGRRSRSHVFVYAGFDKQFAQEV